MSNGEILNDFTPPGEYSGGRPPKYPWDQWLDGQTRRLLKGRDFDCTWDSMALMIRRKARTLGMTVAIHKDQNNPDALIIYHKCPPPSK